MKIGRRKGSSQFGERLIREAKDVWPWHVVRCWRLDVGCWMCEVGCLGVCGGRGEHTAGTRAREWPTDDLLAGFRSLISSHRPPTTEYCPFGLVGRCLVVTWCIVPSSELRLLPGN